MTTFLKVVFQFYYQEIGSKANTAIFNLPDVVVKRKTGRHIRNYEGGSYYIAWNQFGRKTSDVSCLIRKMKKVCEQSTLYTRHVCCL